ncbi:Alpha-(1,3)-fucosyltransferase C [Halotydeus destructor]|nr:Alpha-(1,3)-fucosyltransferase C [Halotydeus destructor]
MLVKPALEMRLYAILFIILTAVCVLINLRSNYHHPKLPMPIYKHNVKLILIWTEFWRGFDASDEFGCNTSCVVTWDKKYLEQASAVVFNFCYTDDVPDHRPAGQLWVMYQLEAPTACGLSSKAERYADIFDITVSYRQDSDIYRPYAHVTRIPSSPVAKETAWLPRVPLSERKMAVGWFVSHCGTISKRELLAEQLAIHIPVDIYGTCGPLTCSRTSTIDCLKMLEDRYMFYFAAENALCEDYVTEKLLNLIEFDIQVIPVVYGGSNYSSILPSNSYIDANSFSNVTLLAAYLNQVASNETLFNLYLESRADYTARHPAIGCQLCNLLNHPREKSVSAKNVSKWFVENKCYDKNIEFE